MPSLLSLWAWQIVKPNLDNKLLSVIHCKLISSCLDNIMTSRIFYVTHKFYSVATISKSKIMNLEKCYFRHLQNEEKVDITFFFKVKESVRQFNLSRKPAETLETLFVRIGANVQKVLKKATKKKTPNEILEISVNLHNSKDASINAQSTCLDLFAAKGPVQLKIYDQIYDVVFNAPWVVSIDLPQCILVDFPVYPEHFVMQHADTNSSCFNWYKGLQVNEKGNIISESHVKWELVGRDYVYVPKAQDIGMKIKLECIPGNHETTGPAVEAISKSTVEAGPGMCPFQTRHMFTNTKLKNKSFRCVTYNILADLYCDSDFTRTALHPYCPPYALHIDYRKLLIFKELQGYNADIMCLQEVDAKIFNHHLEPLMRNEGLSGIFFKKGKEVAEGLALFYQKERFEVLGNEKIVLSEAIKDKTCLQPIWNGVKNNKTLLERLLNRSTAASATFLHSKENVNEIFIVGNTHLYFHPDADHIRLIQGGIFIYWLNDLCKTTKEKFSGKRISLILCGDFNSVPSCGIYQLYTTGLSPSTLPDWKSNEEEAVSNLDLQQDTLLKSACGTPPFTNFTAGFADCLDYIFYDKSTFSVEQVVPLPSIEQLQANTALPSVVFPSDHIALIADLKLL